MNNQNMNPNQVPYQINPNQVAQMTQRQAYQYMTPEQLQRTQVLNFDDFHATARIEKISSKKPAAIFALLGVLLIVMGIFYPTLENFSSGAIDDGYTEYREEPEIVVDTPVSEELSCTLEILGNANGCDEILVAKYTFVDKELKLYTKDYMLKQSANVTETPGELASYLAALEPFLAQQVPGYTMSLQQITNGSITKTSVEYDKLDYAAIPAENQNNYRFDVPFQSTATLEEVKAGLIAKGYTCETA